MDQFRDSNIIESEKDGGYGFPDVFTLTDEKKLVAITVYQHHCFLKSVKAVKKKNN